MDDGAKIVRGTEGSLPGVCARAPVGRELVLKA